MTETLTVTVDSLVGAWLVPVDYAHVVEYTALVLALAIISFLEVLVSDKDQRLSTYLRFGFWTLVCGLFYVTGNYGMGYNFALLYVVVVFWVELGRAFHSIVA